MIRFQSYAFLALLAVGSASALSCQVNDLCLNCAVGDGGDMSGDGGDLGDGGDMVIDADDSTDGGDAGPCVPSGVEVCDGRDNDCNGAVDDNIADLGELCTDQMGLCAGSTKECVNGVPSCTYDPQPEACDNQDNDCNGLTDEGDPGGGARCGTDAGECVAGTNRCVNGAIQCIGAIGSVGGQAEVCNGLDDDCDSLFDEGLTNLGACGSSTNTGECNIGRLECEGGGPVCKESIGPTFEVCDTLDQDCDGNPTNGYNLNTDPTNCGMCNRICDLPNAIEGCAAGNCTVAGCVAGWTNPNGMTADGCEYMCTPTGPEVCNGRDDDCDTQIDEGITLPSVGVFCRTQGECATGTTVQCTGMTGIRCVYADPDVSDDGMGNINPELVCDAKDNDCDGAIDEGQPNLGDACDNGAIGTCRTTGVFACPAGGTGPAVCNAGAGPAPGTETCNGLDDNCNGVIDDGAQTGNLTGQEWVTIPGTMTQIMKYEASRPDARANVQGTQSARVCSRAGVQPWTNITQPQAETACAAVGARLCTETEWQNMCSQPVAPAYPLAGPTGATDFIFIEAENASARTTASSRSWTDDTIQNFSGAGNVRATPDSGTTVSAANAPTQAPRLDFPVNFSSTGNYFVWVRMFATGGGDDLVWVGINTVAGAAAVNTAVSPASGARNQWKWVVGPSINVNMTGTRTVSVFMGDDGVRVDAIAISKDGVNQPPFTEDIWAYGSNPKQPQPQTCNSDEFDTGAAAGDQDDILNTGARAQCFANGTGVNDAFDMSGNVKEWTAERTAGRNPLRGGASNNEVSGTTCNLNFTLADDQFFFPNVGFRCCR